MKTTGIGLAAAIGLAFLLVNVSFVSAGLDLKVELRPPPGSPLPDASGAAGIEETRAGSRLEVEAKGLAIAGVSYFVCIGATMDMSTHEHFLLVVDEDGEGELRTKLDVVPGALSGGHICVGYHDGDAHVHVLMGVIP